MEERLKQRTNGHSNGHEPNGSTPNPYFADGRYISEGERFGAMLFYDVPEGRIVETNLIGINLNGSSRKEKTKE